MDANRFASVVSAPHFTGMRREGQVDSEHVETGDFDQTRVVNRVSKVEWERGGVVYTHLLFVTSK